MLTRCLDWEKARNSAERKKFGIFPNFLTVLNRDSSKGVLESRLRTASRRGNMPTYGSLGPKVVIAESVFSWCDPMGDF